jgi:hypothetical protein
MCGFQTHDVGMYGLDLCCFCEHGNEYILWPNSPLRAWAARAHTDTQTHTHGSSSTLNNG